MTTRYSNMLSAIRRRILSQRDWIENCESAKGRDRRPEQWFDEARGVLAGLNEIRVELETIEANAASYEAWKATLPKQRGAA